MATGSARRGGVVQGIRIDLRRLHATWMELIYPRQRSSHDVLGKWTPSTTRGMVGYRAWSVLGVLIVALLYPLLLVGLATRFYSRRIDTMIAGIGIFGVVAVAAVVWGGLTVVAHFQLSWSDFLAVGAAGFVATVAAGLAALATRKGGRATTVAIAYPAAMTAIFLPPVVAAVVTVEPGTSVPQDAGYAGQIIGASYDLAVWILDNVLVVGGLNEWLRNNYELEGMGYVLMWLGISVPLGWLLGLLVTLADVIRPSGE